MKDVIKQRQLEFDGWRKKMESNLEEMNLRQYQIQDTFDKIKGESKNVHSVLTEQLGEMVEKTAREIDIGLSAIDDKIETVDVSDLVASKKYETRLNEICENLKMAFDKQTILKDNTSSILEILHGASELIKKVVTVMSKGGSLDNKAGLQRENDGTQNRKNFSQFRF